MWEEHPDYQKLQAGVIGLLLVGILVFFIVGSIVERDWEMLKQTLLFAGAFLAAIGLLSGTAWLAVKLLTRVCMKSNDEKRHKD